MTIVGQLTKNTTKKEKGENFKITFPVNPLFLHQDFYLPGWRFKRYATSFPADQGFFSAQRRPSGLFISQPQTTPQVLLGDIHTKALF